MGKSFFLRLKKIGGWFLWLIIDYLKFCISEKGRSELLFTRVVFFDKFSIVLGLDLPANFDKLTEQNTTVSFHKHRADTIKLDNLENQQICLLSSLSYLHWTTYYLNAQHQPWKKGNYQFVVP